MIKHANIRTYGRVQGVFFRDSAKQKAIEFDLAGFARNEPAGTVYIEAEGEEEKLNEFINWCKEGPEGAFVGKIDITFSSVKNLSNFELN